MSLESAIYEGSVRHRRFDSVKREFSYRIFMVYLDLAEIEQVMSIHPLWSTRPRSPARYRRADYLGPAGLPLDRCVRDLVEQRTGGRPEGPIRMLSNLRYLGVLENPVSFYYCFDRDGTELETVVAEVTNTPWRDRYSYVIDGRTERGSTVSSKVDKMMHVSPLMDMDRRYELRFGLPGPSIPVHIDSQKDGRTTFDATLRLSRSEITRASMTRILATYPPMSLRVRSGIHRQAAITWLRGARYQPRPAPHSLKPVPDPNRSAGVCPYESSEVGRGPLSRRYPLRLDRVQAGLVAKGHRPWQRSPATTSTGLMRSAGDFIGSSGRSRKSV